MLMRIASTLRATRPALVLSVWSGLCGCGGWTPGGDADRVVIYTALDREFSEPILREYESEAGVRIDAKYDVESTKTVGLTNAIIAEADRPRADLFWNNEILNTLRLQRLGLLDPFTPEHAGEIPEQYKAADGTWYGFAARARVLIVNTDLVPESDRPTSILDLADPKWEGKAAIAKPLFGTTASHAACLFEAWGESRAKQYFRDLKGNGVAILSGNKQVAQDVASGRFAFGLTDTDDAMVMIEQLGAPVAIVNPDQEDGGLGTLFIPNTLARIKGSPHPSAADELADAILRPEVEAALAAGPSAQIPLLETTDASARVDTPRTIKAMSVDFEAAAARWDEVARFIREEFATES
jgi:iron(III) transport system substrate-binding protein